MSKVIELLSKNISNAQTNIQTWKDLVFNPKDYGAKGNGITNDLVSIQRTINAAHAAGGGVVFFPPGVYIHSNIITVPSGVELVGVGSNSILRATDDDQTAIRFDSATGSGISNMRLEATGTVRQSGNNSHKVFFTGSSNCYCRDVTIRGSTAAGILVSNSTNISVEDNDIADTLADGIHSTATSSNVVINNNKLNNTGDDSIAVVSYQSNAGLVKRVTITNNVIGFSRSRGIAVVGGESVIISNNQVADTRAAGIYVAMEASYVSRGVDNVIIDSNIVYRPNTNDPVLNQAGIHLSSASESFLLNNITVSNNQVYDSNWRMLSIGKTTSGTIIATNIKIIGNIFKGNSANEGINIQNASVVEIKDNIVMNSYTLGIFVENNSETVDIHGNRVIDCNQSSGAQNDGINIRAKQSMVRFNTIIDSISTLQRAIEVGSDALNDCVMFGNVPIGGAASITPIPTASFLSLSRRMFETSALPSSGTFSIGDRAMLRSSEGLPSEYTCVVSGSPGTWRLTKQAGIRKGTTANRPSTLTTNDTGLQYLDTTLAADGKLIVWNGTNWVDATGTTV